MRNQNTGETYRRTLKKTLKYRYQRAEAPKIGQGILNGYPPPDGTLFWMDKEVFPFEDAFYSEIVWFWPVVMTKGKVIIRKKR
jgi:hypothetical protein